MKKIIILSRVSTSVQNIESQTNELIKHAEHLGYDRKHQIIIEDVESAIKLTEEERQGLQKLKEHIRNDKEIDCVICWEPSRLSRQQKTLYSIRDFLVENKIQLYILNPYVRLLTDDRTKIDTTASIVFSLFSTLAENEMLIKKERFIRAKNELRRQGKKNAGAVIFGYMKDKEKRCVPHPINSMIISEIYNYYANGDTSLWETYQWAARRWPGTFKVTTYTKGQHKIRHFFEVDIYAKGNWCYPPIVTLETWETVHKKMSEARCKPRYNSKLNYLGRGKVRCMTCGNVMTGIGGNVKAYFCSTDKEHSLQINIEALDWVIWEETRTAANIMGAMDGSRRIVENNKMIEGKKVEIEQIERYIEDKKARIDKLVALYLDDKIDEKIYERRYNEMKDEIDKNIKKTESLKAQIIELEGLMKTGMNIKPILLDDITDFNIKLQYVRDLIENVWVGRDDRGIIITIEWKVNLIIPRSIYRYIYKGGKRKIYRINEDGTEDFIMNW